jgi:hypothetical protein
VVLDGPVSEGRRKAFSLVFDGPMLEGRMKELSLVAQWMVLSLVVGGQ